MADLMQQARELVEKLDSAVASWPTVYASDREIISLLLAAATTIESLREAALRAAPEGYVLVPAQTLESIRDSSTDPNARGFAAGALAARPQGVKDA